MVTPLVMTPITIVLVTISDVAHAYLVHLGYFGVLNWYAATCKTLSERWS